MQFINLSDFSSTALVADRFSYYYRSADLSYLRSVMSENTYAELLLPGESKKRESREILSFRPRTMKVKEESPRSSSDINNYSERSPKFQRTSSHSELITTPLMVSEEPIASVVHFEVSSVMEPKQEPNMVVTVTKALETISMHLTNNKKFSKALRLMIQLVESSMDETNGDIFFVHLKSLMANCPADRDISSPPYSQGYSDLVTLYYSKKSCLNEQKNFYLLETYYVLVCLSASLATDDSYSFNKACNELKAIITNMHSCGSSRSGIDVSQNHTSEETSTTGSKGIKMEIISQSAKSNRENAILICLEIAFRIYHWTWAKQPCDAVYACAAERRLLFSEEGREGLDLLTTAITTAQRKDNSWSGPQTIRTYNSTAHPLLSKNVGLLR